MEDPAQFRSYTTSDSPYAGCHLASMQTRSPTPSREQWPDSGSTTSGTPLPAFLSALALIYIVWGPSWGMPTLAQLNDMLISLSRTLGMQ
jgi:hypothetical protein